MNSATYLERSASMRTEADASYAQKLTALKQPLADFVGMARDGLVGAANTMREAGLLFQAWSGHEQITLDFWKSKCDGRVPFEFEAAKLCVSISRKMPKAAKTAQDVAQYFQPVMWASGELELPERSEPQQRTPIADIQRFFREFTLMRQPLTKILAAKPMEQWPAAQVEEFLDETDWIERERERAKKLKAR